jgi:hypothetical protein
MRPDFATCPNAMPASQKANSAGNIATIPEYGSKNFCVAGAFSKRRKMESMSSERENRERMNE